MNTSDREVAFDVSALERELDADFLIFSAEINHGNVDKLIKVILDLPDRKHNVALCLTTYGGDPDAAFRLASFLQRKYQKLIVYIFGFCKSAGTLIALAAHEIVMSDFGELGPLDIQIPKEDDLRKESGLNIQQALEVLKQKASEIFKDCLINILELDRDNAVIALKTVEDISSAIAVGLLAPISSQIDPARLGEIYRQSRIAVEYGRRLDPTPEKNRPIEHLTSQYPSHSFVINYQEASELFGCVREPTEPEQALETAIFDRVRDESDCVGTVAALIAETATKTPDLPEDESPP